MCGILAFWLHGKEMCLNVRVPLRTSSSRFFARVLGGYRSWRILVYCFHNICWDAWFPRFTGVVCGETCKTMRPSDQNVPDQTDLLSGIGSAKYFSTWRNSRCMITLVNSCIRSIHRKILSNRTMKSPQQLWYRICSSTVPREHQHMDRELTDEEQKTSSKFIGSERRRLRQRIFAQCACRPAPRMIPIYDVFPLNND